MNKSGLKLLATILLCAITAVGFASEYNFNCDLSCQQQCAEDVSCLIRCYTCCPLSSVAREVDCALCGGEWIGGRCTLGGEPCTIAAPELSAPDVVGVGNSYTIEWTAVENAQRYQICECMYEGCSDNSSTCWLVTGTSREFHHTTPGTYYYRVKGLNSYCQGTWSQVVPVVIQTDTSQSPPQHKLVEFVSNPDKSPVRIEGNGLLINFRYTAPVDILVGLADCNFTNIYWLNPNDCSIHEAFSWARRTPNLHCLIDAVLPRLHLHSGVIFWLVSSRDLSTLDFENGPYELKFYFFGTCR